MKRTGQLSINNGESRLDDGTLLARCAATDPIGSGTSFLQNRGLHDGDPIWVTGQDGAVGSVSVFCMDDTGPNQPAAMPPQEKQRPAIAAVKAVARAKPTKTPTRTKKKMARKGKPRKSRPKVPSPKRGKSS